MFETAELGRKVSKTDYEAVVPALRVDLLNAQYDLRRADFSVLILLAGDDHHGCNEILELLHEWMDARYMETQVFGLPTDEERDRPRFWRYWRSQPRRGRIGIYMGAWALAAVADQVTHRINDTEFQRRVTHARNFEEALNNDGVLVLKYWIHLPHKEHQKRRKQAKKSGPPLRVDDADWKVLEKYSKAMPVVQHYLRKTTTDRAPWHVVEGTNRNHRNLEVARLLREALTTRLGRDAAPPRRTRRKSPPSADGPTLLDEIDLTLALEHDAYRKRLDKLQARLYRLSFEAREAGIAAVIVLEGWDAAGKGGVIRRITAALDARDYRVVPIAAPTEEEKARHYLWRFWTRLPRDGSMLLFDRSWYGRVLVERVEGFARPDEWARAYEEINDFEEQLVEHGVLLLKFWLHIDPDEQLRRFREREKTPFKKYKLTDDDYRNREKWPIYARAVSDMVERTSTEIAPWHLIAANNKRWARVRVVETLVQGLKNRLGS